jgi:amino acid adenylation domain-containing protein/thioester reductase-like protein
VTRETAASDKLASLSLEKRKLLERLLQKDSAPARVLRSNWREGQTGPIRAVTSGAQQRLWFIDRLEGSSVAYHIPLALRLRGELDSAALQAALDALMSRHESLRTVFPEVDGEPVQEIRANVKFPLQLTDLSGEAAERVAAEVQGHVRYELDTPFRLSVGPLIRGRLLRLSSAEHVLLIVVHHIVSDGWSNAVLIRELGVLYHAHKRGESDPLPMLPIQYVDYAQWQREASTDERLRERLQFWRDHLHAAPAMLELPADRPRPPVQSYRGAAVGVTFGRDLTAQLKSVSRRFDCTLAMTLFTAWSILLSRLSGQGDVVSGMPVANRPRAELEGLIGFFVNTLAVRVRMDDDPRLADLLQRTKQTLIAAYANQDVPFERVVEALQPERSLSHSPIFQAMFAFQNEPLARIELPDLKLIEEEVRLRAEKFDLTLMMQESADGIVGSINYATDLFDEATIGRWVGYFERILREIGRDARQKVGAVQLLSDDERHQLLEVFNATRRPYPQERLVHELFEEQVERTPHSVAVVYEGQSLTYAELNSKANQLARHLRGLGVSPDSRIAICVERSLEMVIGLIGILKAGGAYVPLDPNYPADRLAYMLADAAPPVLLIQEHLRAQLPPTTGRVIAVDSEWSDVAEHAGSNLDSAALGVRSDCLAYVIYTSGSTGKPKGAMNEHRAVVNRLHWMQSEYHLTDRDRVLQKTPFSFDVSVWEFFWTLLSGARLVVARPQGHQDPVYLARLIEEAEVTTLHFVPSMLQIFVDQLEADRCPSLRHVVCSGEELPVALQNKCLERLPQARLSNLYGPTEAAVDVTFWECRLDPSSTRVPIGRPIANTRMYVLDQRGQPVPLGVAGEIYIGGDGVGRGYLNRDELTAERFLHDPFDTVPQARMYKTGDLGRWRTDGAIEYLGRNDHQVKIRGFRIELGEIEAQLARHEQVKEVVVVAREDVAGEKRLVAYVVPDDPSSAPSVEELRAHLKSALPEHMVPSAFVLLERMPLTPNGKLDRRALPVPELEAYVSRGYEAPQGEVEEILAGIWQSLLRVERVGRQDNFFELGGHSLLIVQMMERLRRVGLSTELRRVFDSASLAELASALVSEANEQYAVPPNLIPPGCEAITPEMLPLVELEAKHIERIVQAVPGGAANVQDIYPLVPLQEGILFHHLFDEQRGDTYVMPIVLSVSSRERLDELITALQSVIDRHDVLRTAVLWEELPRPVQVVYRRAMLPVKEVALQTDRSTEEQIQEWIRPERQRLDIRQAPLLRLQVAEDRGSGQWYVLLQVHHMTDDRSSLAMVTAEVVAHLEGRAQGLPASVPYRNHVAQALAYADKHDAEAFFRGKLQEVDEPTAPFGLLDVHGDGSRIEEAREELEASLAQRIRAQARRMGVSAATLFHAAWGLVTAHTSGRDDVVFGSVLLGRMQGSAGAQRTLGIFINTLPLRLRLRDVTAKELVEHTQRELVELLTHEQASLAAAQRCSGVAGNTPLFTTLLNYRHYVSNPDAEWSSARDVRVETWQERTNYPITISLDDLGQGFSLNAQTDHRIDPVRIIGYLRTAVSALVEALEQAPQTAALSLSILPEAERRQLLEAFNATQMPYPQERLIHELFEEQVERTPHEVAVLSAGEHLTYRELNSRANQLARYLRQQGAGPDRFVGLCVERGIEMVVGLLGILKSGGAYVPLDPNYPQHRLEYMLEDTAPIAVLTQEHLRERLPAGRNMVALDTQWSEIAQHAATNISQASPQMSSRNLAYVIYTSGSTGRPKGVAIEHRNAVNMIWWAQAAMNAEVFEQTLQSTSLNFDLSVYECFVPLVSGGSLRVVQNALALASEPAANVTLINTVPSAISGLLDAGGIPASTRVVNLAGEALKKDLVERIFAHSSVQCVSNLYGPSETTTYSTWVAMPREQGFNATIGHPIANTQIHILDQRRQLVPVGVVGEIYIGGTGVARGYLNREELTAERFLADPFSSEPQARMYKTGDLGRWRADGTIEYLGRNDHQVKIRGFRIELGEIEAQLARHEQVKEVVVVAREDVAGEKRLVAYVVPDDPSSAPSVEELRAHLKSALPEHMVPSAFVMLERMPLTPNGKLDRRALPAPELGAYISRGYEAPQGEVEEILAGIWQSLLRVERVGRQDNFFELGGHSLLIVQMMERLRRVGLSTELRRVFDSASLAELASALASEASEQYEVPPNLIPPGCEAITPEMLPLVELEAGHIERIVQAVPGGAANVQDIYPLVPLQEGILFHHLFDEQRGDTYVLPTALSVSSRERLDELIAALQSVIDRHDVLRTAVLWEELPRPVQVVYRRAMLPVKEVALQTDRSTEEQIQEWMRPERQRLDIRQAPLLRLQVAEDRGSGQWYALLQLHHMTIDHVTLEIVTAEVVAHLEGRAQGLPASVPYRNHVAQALAYANKHDAEAFFRGKLQEVDEPSAPFGLLDVRGDGSKVEEAHEELEASLAQRIRAQARRMGVSAATLFHAAWALVTAHTSGRDDVVFGSVLLGRMQGSAGAQRILGMFINTLPLRLRLRDVTAKELVEHTQRELVQLLTHEQASLAAAQRCSAVAGSTPLFTTLFNYRHSVPNPDAQWSSAHDMRVVAGYERTNYPITFSIDDLGQGFSLTTQTDHQIDPVRIIGYVRTAVRALVEALEQAPQTAVLSLSILPEAERRQLLEVFNATQIAHPRERLIHELFEEQVERTPDAIAVEYRQHSLTYAELNRRANQLARDLRKAGVGPDAVVGICLDRGIEMIVALLATLKAGGAYLPLDPNYPLERLQYMLHDAAPRVVLIQEQLRDSLHLDLGDVTVIDPELGSMTMRNDRNLPKGEIGLTADHLAYLIYTSGSTGRPKGTGMPHRAMVNLIEWHRRSFTSEQASKVLQFAALSFDVAFQEAFSTLCTGGTLVLLDEWVRRDAHSLIELLAAQRVERLFVPPLMLQSLAECFHAAGMPSLRLRDIITAGEQLRVSPEIVAFVGHLDGCRLHNHYGPTETHVVTALTLTGDPQQWPPFPSIGAPIDNASIYILDERRQPVPFGVVGEVYIGGVGIARGYLGRTELTQQRFLADPFSSDTQAKMYKAGDLGRWMIDGTIEYLGRNDDQVKLRGFRIEIGEIEAQLTSHENVKEAAVLLREDVVGEKRLVAYVVPREMANQPSAEELRAHVKRVLPEHMTPSAFVVLESLPLTPSGKLNRRVLPPPELGAYAQRQYEAPGGEVEESLARIWQEVLKVQLIGRDDNFFDLGGHSLLALKVLVRINEYFGTSLRVIDTYQSPTIRDLAVRVRAGAMCDDEVVDLATEAALDPQLTPCPGSVRVPPRNILLTGATGFVGRFLLSEILRTTTATVHCLVRDLAQGRALARLQETLSEWDLWRDEFEHRIVVVRGDLKLPRLGIEEEVYEELCRTIDVVYHCATSMNHLETYAMAKPANVEAAKEFVRFATRHRPKLINYISTLGVFSSSAKVGRKVVSEQSDIDHEEHRHSQGYLASKWVGEKIFMNADARGIPCNIFRLGLVWADAARGRFDELQHAYRVLKSCLLSGYGIRDYRHPLPPVPVDYVVRAVVHLGTQHSEGGGIFHISSPEQKIKGMFECCNDRLGTSLELLPLYDWICQVRRLHRGGESLPVVPLIEYAFSMSEETFTEHQRTVRTVANVDFDCTSTYAQLEAAGIVAPQLDEELLGTCLEDMLTRDADLRQWADDPERAPDVATLLASTSGLQIDDRPEGQLHVGLRRGASDRVRARSGAQQ